MKERNNEEISGQVFSPRLFYKQLALGDRSPSGLVPFRIKLASSGVHSLAPGNSDLSVEDLWLSGIYAQALERRRFLDDLQEGLIPSPLNFFTNSKVAYRFIYTSPESFLKTPQTLLAALGLADRIAALALKSNCWTCYNCGDEISKYKDSQGVIRALITQFNGKEISLRFESPNERLSEWANSKGFKTQLTADKLHSVLIDTGLCTQERLTSISSLINSALKIPDLFISCLSGSQHSAILTRNGHCARCNVSGQQISMRVLKELISGEGFAKDNSSHAGAIILAPNLTLHSLLSTPLSTLDLSFDSKLREATALLNKLGLGALTFATMTDSILASDLAKICVASNLLTDRSPGVRILIMLPSGIFSKADSGLIEEQLKKMSQDIAIYISEGVLSDAETQENNRSLAEKDKLALASIPVFSSGKSQYRTVCEEMRLFEPLTKLFAASLDAKVQGLTAKDFAIFGVRSPRFVCRSCRGLGIITRIYPEMRQPVAHPCPVCLGARCEPPISTTLFRGVAFPQILNRTISESYDILSALPKVSAILKIIDALDLLHLPLGMPLSLLSHSETRRLALAGDLILKKAFKKEGQIDGAG
jgi:hypothetical protein